MENNAPSLGDQIARLHGTVQAQEKCAWIPAPIHTLIMAALARIFGRLEALLCLWQAGTLPAPQPRTPSSRDSTKIAPPRPATLARNRHRAAKLTAASPEPNVIQSEAKDQALLLQAPGFWQFHRRPATALSHTARPRPTHHPPSIRIFEKRTPQAMHILAQIVPFTQ